MKNFRLLILSVFILTSFCSCRQVTVSEHPKLYGTFNSTDSVLIATSFVDIKSVTIRCDTNSVIATISLRQIPGSIIINDSSKDFFYQMDLVFDSITDTTGQDKANRYCEFRYTNFSDWYNGKNKERKVRKVPFDILLALCDNDCGFNYNNKTPTKGGKFAFTRIEKTITIKFKNYFAGQTKVDTNTTWCLRTYFKNREDGIEMDYLTPTPLHFKDLQRGNNLSIRY